MFITYFNIHKEIIFFALKLKRYQIALLTPELWKRKLRTAPVFPKVRLQDFARNKYGHPCLNGEVCVHTDGTVYPCIMDRMNILGNACESSLRDIVEGKQTQAIWGLSKDNIPVCWDCEYRYACFDCRPLAMSVAESMQSGRGLLTKDPCCLYSPYNGEWGNAENFVNSISKLSTDLSLTINQPVIK